MEWILLESDFVGETGEPRPECFSFSFPLDIADRDDSAKTRGSETAWKPISCYVPQNSVVFDKRRNKSDNYSFSKI